MEMFLEWLNQTEKVGNTSKEKRGYIGLYVIQEPFMLSNGYVVYELKKCCKKYKKSKACKKCPRN